MRIIAHLDMDAFFAAVEERDRPRLRGKPIVVGADPEDGHGRGIVSTANYKAREYGIHSAMPITRAWRLAQNGEARGGPRAVFIAPSYRKYSDASRRIFSYLASRIPQIEQTSVDEAYMDVSFTGSYAQARGLMAELQAYIHAHERLTCSVGIGPNKLVAKIASDFKKPSGLTVVPDEKVEDFLEPLPLRKIPGIGPKTDGMFGQKRIYTIKDARRFSEEELVALMGSWGASLYRKLRGVSDSEVSTESEDAKSVGEQETFEIDTRDPIMITERLQALAKDVWRRFSRDGFVSFRRVVVTVRFSDFETKTRSHTLKEPADCLPVLKFEAMRLILPFFDARENARGRLMRLVGVRVEQLR